MDLKEAEQIVNKYGKALARGTGQGVSRFHSWLPASKERIMQAFKLSIAFLIEKKALTKQNAGKLIEPLCYLNSFVEDSKAKRINETASAIESGNSNKVSPIAMQEYTQYMMSVFGMDIRENINSFISEVSKYDIDDSLFYQRVYTVIGLEYSPKKKRSFWDIFGN